MDVAVLPRGLGLEQYETIFRENDIDTEVLRELTDGDLEKIGVSFAPLRGLGQNLWSPFKGINALA